jgi:uncharacterized protein with von Willebrand factor type A (vWA) domain
LNKGSTVLVVNNFISYLRAQDIPVSMTETIDAFRAIDAIGMKNKSELKDVLRATLIKNERHEKTFSSIYDLYFSRLPFETIDEFTGEFSELSEDASGDLTDAILQALLNNDTEALKELAKKAVQRFGDMESGRPVAGVYYLYRTLRNIGFDDLLNQLMGHLKRENPELKEDKSAGYKLKLKVSEDELKNRLNAFRDIIDEEIKRRLVYDRGIDAMVKSTKKPLPEDLDIMHATSDELMELRHLLFQLSRKLAIRLAQKRKTKKLVTLDWKKTVRNSLSTGGVPITPVFKKKKKAKPDLILLADISGSVASFARFTLQLVHAISSQFSKVRSFVFVDGVDEVTKYFEESENVLDAIYKINTESKAVLFEGHSNYGKVLKLFKEKYFDELGDRTSVVILGDARNNYHASESEILDEIKQKVKHVYWLNPEPKNYWDTGDSVIGKYGVFCDGVYECRTLRQLEFFVNELA